MTLLQFVLGGVALLLLVPVVVLFAEVFSAVTQITATEEKEGERHRLAVLVPAHNEAGVIAETLRFIAPQLAKSDRVLVVADNCTDETASIALAEGAEVVVRTNNQLRGKGYALDFGVRHLERDPPEIVIVIDADCQATDGSIDCLVRKCVATGRPVQGLYLMRAPRDASPKMRIAEFAWVVKNQVRPTGLHRLGLPCQLMGTGMAFPWSSINSAVLASGHIVEDLRLGIDLALVGTAPLFCPDALVTSSFPTSSEGIQGQRTRWEHGHLGVILQDAPRLLCRSIASFSASLTALTLDLCVPPLALLTILVVANWGVALTFYCLMKAKFPLVISTISALLLALSVYLSWVRYGRKIISFRGLAYALIYAALKIPLYARFLAVRQIEWVRSKRDGEK